MGIEERAKALEAAIARLGKKRGLRARTLMRLYRQSTDQEESVEDRLQWLEKAERLVYADRPPGVSHRSEPAIDTIDDIKKLLDLGSLLPPRVDSEHATHIVISLLRPTRRSGSRFHVSYMHHHHVESPVQRKTPGYDAGVYTNTRDWLLRHGVLLIPKKKSSVVYSLNPHPSRATESGRPIVLRILEVKRRLKQYHGG